MALTAWGQPAVPPSVDHTSPSVGTASPVAIPKAPSEPTKGPAADHTSPSVQPNSPLGRTSGPIQCNFAHAHVVTASSDATLHLITLDLQSYRSAEMMRHELIMCSSDTNSASTLYIPQ